MFALLRFNQLTHNVVWAQLFNFGLLATNASFHKLFTTAGEDFPASHPHHTQRAGCQGLTRQTPDQTLLRKKVRAANRANRPFRSTYQVLQTRPEFSPKFQPKLGKERCSRECGKLGKNLLQTGRAGLLSQESAIRALFSLKC